MSITPAPRALWATGGRQIHRAGAAEGRRTLLLDGATRAGDTESEQAIQAALGRLMSGRTVIVIAYWLSTLKRFDRIIEMDCGRMEDDGSPNALPVNFWQSRQWQIPNITGVALVE